ncbi:MAG TPA: flavin reductase [Anaerolineales bacterium]|nr:flavin reductase [Anaerolineales bacterium]
MKREIGITQPEYLIEDWPGKYDIFSWLEYIVTVPNPIFIVTTRKANGASNANLHSWGLLVGEKGNYSSLVALLDNTHTYANILREGEWCVCFPSFQHYHQCFETIRYNESDNDEITDAGFTVELPKGVRAPRIAECSINLECRLEWHHPLYENSHWHLFAGRVIHLAMDESAMIPDPVERLRIMGLMYNVRSTVHPITGEQYGPNALGLLSQIEDIFNPQRQRKDGG